ncbi:MAG: segregation/condensation protein A [Candidatus Micrarchaeia archaeon]
MAAGEELSTYYDSYGKFDIEELVKNTMWKDLLFELVESNRLDPWDIDIAVIADEYARAIKKMKVLDLHMPANIIFAASVLLRMKSETLQIFEDLDQIEGNSEGDAVDLIPTAQPEVPGIIFKLRTQPKRKITLEELMDALEEAMKMQDKKEKREEEYSTPLLIKISREDIGSRMRKIFDMIKLRMDAYKMVTFADLASQASGQGSVLLDVFVPLLFLAHKDYIVLSQDNFFGEIFVRLKKDELDG